MNRLLFTSIIMLAFTFIVKAQDDAKSILDKTTNMLAKNQGIKAEFKIFISNKEKQTGAIEGDICIKNDKFIMTTENGGTWFNGKTLWSYVASTEEVNISNPETEELQSINPYLLLNSYQKGYVCSLGKSSNFRNKAIYNVILTPIDSSNDIKTVTIYIQKYTYHPLYIKVTQKNETQTKIEINNYQFKQEFSDNMFNFDKTKYPDVEEIDLR